GEGNGTPGAPACGDEGHIAAKGYVLDASGQFFYQTATASVTVTGIGDASEIPNGCGIGISCVAGTRSFHLRAVDALDAGAVDALEGGAVDALDAGARDREWIFVTTIDGLPAGIVALNERL